MLSICRHKQTRNHLIIKLVPPARITHLPGDLLWRLYCATLGLTLSADIKCKFFIAALNAQDLEFSERAKKICF